MDLAHRGIRRLEMLEEPAAEHGLKGFVGVRDRVRRTLGDLDALRGVVRDQLGGEVYCVYVSSVLPREPAAPGRQVEHRRLAPKVAFVQEPTQHALEVADSITAGRKDVIAV